MAISYPAARPWISPRISYPFPWLPPLFRNIGRRSCACRVPVRIPDIFSFLKTFPATNLPHPAGWVKWFCHSRESGNPRREFLDPQFKHSGMTKNSRRSQFHLTQSPEGVGGFHQLIPFVTTIWRNRPFPENQRPRPVHCLRPRRHARRETGKRPRLYT